MRLGWLIVTLAACGRIGFDPLGGGGGPGDGGGGDTRFTSDGTAIDTNIVFVTRGNLAPGTFGGLAGADAACASSATAAGLPGHYVAFLSTTTVNAIDRIAAARGWKRTDGAPFADTPADVAAGRVFTNPMYLADGTRASTGAYWVVTGSTAAGIVSANGTCTDYASTSGFVSLGAATASGGGFLEASTGADCAQGERIYCFGIDRSVVLPAPTLTATTVRRAFVSSAWMSGGGLASADAQCQADATAHGLPGMYRALLGGTTSSPASRFATGAPWVRLDGIQLAATADALLAGNLLEPLNLAADGSYIVQPTQVWTGATSITSTSNAQTCNDWSSTVNGQSGDLGRPAFADLYWFFGSSQTCNNAARLYCLEQ